jgi:transglutaminase-like putative cysteine protease
MELEAAASAALLDHAGLDLESAERVTYVLHQTFRYDYDAPVESLRQRLVVLPPRRHGDLHRRSHLLQVEGAPARRQTRQDAAGNTVVSITAPRVESHVEFRLVAVLERLRGSGACPLPASAARDRRLLRPTRLTEPDDRLREMAASLKVPGDRPLDTAGRICQAVHEAITYEYGVTSVTTTAAEALDVGRGVCQDSAHVMLAVCRLLGLPARYVSGHLLGQGGTHAWVEVVVSEGDGASAVAFDPCNGRRAGGGYVTVATGRDYADVAPTSGSYVGAATGRLTCTRRVGVVAVAA